MIHHYNCPLCSGGNISPFLDVRDHFLSKELFSLFKCQDCRFIFTQDYPEEPEIEKYYESDDYISHSDSNQSLTGKIYRSIRRLMLIKKKNLVKKACHLTTGSILDIGSGTGHFLNTMKTAGWSISGIEPNKKAREYSSSVFKIAPSIPGQIHSLPSESFDCITLWHALEHFYEPYKYFEEIYRLIKPNGLVIVALPNSRSFDSEYYKNNWAAFDVPRHLWHFNTDSFNSFIKKAGFRCEAMSSLPFDVFYISVLSEKYKRSSASFLQGFIKGKLFFLFSLFRIKKSSSIIYFLKKSLG
jgi:2-polyprenyl-3-methyl-5-hydroxy-6-metoxy-1,4-benzoquinol methylase